MSEAGFINADHIMANHHCIDPLCVSWADTVCGILDMHADCVLVIPYCKLHLIVRGSSTYTLVELI